MRIEIACRLVSDDAEQEPEDAKIEVFDMDQNFCDADTVEL